VTKKESQSQLILALSDEEGALVLIALFEGREGIGENA